MTLELKMLSSPVMPILGLGAKFIPIPVGGMEPGLGVKFGENGEGGGRGEGTGFRPRNQLSFMFLRIMGS